MTDDELRLIQRAQQGDAAACAELYDIHYDPVYRYCYYRVTDVALAQDLASEVFVRMVENLDKFDARGRPMLAWLYTIARNLIADTYRRKDQTNHLSLEEALIAGLDGPATVAERHQLAECIAHALGRLTEEQRQVILLKFVEDLSNAQVARMLNKPEGAVKSLQHRALAALRRVLEKEPCDEA
jgi:RNA polymerase sigma-70 factor (ECF subfamily)